MTDSEAKQRIGSLGFVKWKVFLDEEEMNGFDKTHYYLAQIVQYLVKINSKNSTKVMLKDFLLKFTNKEQNVNKEITKDEKIEQMRKSRMAWGGTGLVKVPDMSDLDEAKRLWYGGST